MADLLFTKMVASGNDFIIIDNRQSQVTRLNLVTSELAGELCERKTSVGADGLLVIEDSKKADFKMKVFNPDGSEVSMCGNGSRCTALYAVENKIAGKELAIETGAGIVEAEVIGLSVKIRLTDPKNIKLDSALKIGNRIFRSNYINTGVPHVVIFVKDTDKVDVRKLGSRIRYHKRFKPKGTNVDFVKVTGPKNIEIRTYERGVEAETLACGTGAAASAVIAGLTKGLKPHIDVLTRSGEILRVYFDFADSRKFAFKKRKLSQIRANSRLKIKNVYLEGEAKTLYNGRINYV